MICAELYIFSQMLYLKEFISNTCVWGAGLCLREVRPAYVGRSTKSKQQRDGSIPLSLVVSYVLLCVPRPRAVVGITSIIAKMTVPISASILLFLFIVPCILPIIYLTARQGIIHLTAVFHIGLILPPTSSVNTFNTSIIVNVQGFYFSAVSEKL